MTTRMVRRLLMAGVLMAAGNGALVAQQVPVEFPGRDDRATLERASFLDGDALPDIFLSPSAGAIPTHVLSGANGALMGAGNPFGGFGGGARIAAGDVTGDGIADIVAGMGPGGGLVTLLNGANLAGLGGGYPFGPAFGGGISVALGDFNGDGRNDIVTGQASGGGTVSVFNGINYTPILSVAPFGSGYGGGVHVATGDVDGDGRADIIAGQASGGVVSIVSGATGAVVASGIPFGGVNGVFVAAGDVTNDGRAEAIVAPGSGNGPVLVFDIATLTVVGSFTPFPGGFAGGVRVAATDLSGDGRVEILAVPGPGLTPTVRIYDGATFANVASYPFSADFAAVGALVAVPAATGIRFTSAASTSFPTGVAASFIVRTGGSPAVTSITSVGALPSGLSFTDHGNGTATLSGTLGAGIGGTFPLTLIASNGVGAPATQNFVLTVNRAPSFSSAAAGSFERGVTSTFTITTAAFPTATVSLTRGTLPAGLTFAPGANGTATISGATNDDVGTVPLTFEATNGINPAATQNFTLSKTGCMVVTVLPTPGALAAGTYSSAYTQSFTATGGSGHTFAVTSGAVPPGMTLSSAGALTGSPSQTGSYSFTITATASDACAGASSYTLVVSPNAQNETFNNGVGNTQYSVGGGTPATPAVVISGDVRSNDSGPGALTTGPASIASTNGGQVTMGTNGTFLYTPPVGFAGPSDTFTYLLTDGNGRTDTAIVTINMSAVVWYVNAAAGGGGTGRSNDPFNTMTAASTAAQFGHVIYVHSGSPAGATTLKANQLLRGAGESYALNGLTIAAGTAPVLSGTVTLNDNVAVRALDVNTGAATAVSGSGSGGSSSLTNVSITSSATALGLTSVGGSFSTSGGSIVATGGGTSVAINGGSAGITIGSPVTSAAGRSVSIQNRGGGAVSFFSLVTDGGGGVLLDSNTGSSVAFSGGLAIATNGTDGFTATNGGTVTATQNNTSVVNVISADNATALNVTNTQIGSDGLTFRSIRSVAGSATAIILDNTGVGGSHGGLTVTGNGTTDSGGAISTKTGADGSLTSGNGVYLNSTRNVVLNRMSLYNFENSAIVGRNVHGFTINDSAIDVSGTTPGVHEAPVIFGLPAPAPQNGLQGTALLRNTAVSGGIEDNIAIYGQSGTFNLTIDNPVAGPPYLCRVEGNSPTTGSQGLRVEVHGSVAATVAVNQCLMRGNRDASVHATALGDSTLTVSVNGTGLGRSNQGDHGIVVTNGGNATVTANLTNNGFSGLTGQSIRLGQLAGNASASSLLSATVTNNTFDSADQSTSPVILVSLGGSAGAASKSRLRFEDNFSEYAGFQPTFLLDTPDAASAPVADVVMTRNHFDVFETSPGTITPYGLVLRSTAPAANVCGNVFSNTSHWIGNGMSGGGIRAEQTQGTFRLERGSQTLATPAATVLSANNGPYDSLPGSTTSISGSLQVVENGTCLVP